VIAIFLKADYNHSNKLYLPGKNRYSINKKCLKIEIKARRINNDEQIAFIEKGVINDTIRRRHIVESVQRR